jgi:transposase-like protein
MKVVHAELAWETGGCPPSAPKPELRMNLHKNARTTPHSRLLMVRRVLDERQPATKVAADFGVSERTVRKWLARWRAGGEPALNDRSSAPAPPAPAAAGRRAGEIGPARLAWRRGQVRQQSAGGQTASGRRHRSAGRAQNDRAFDNASCKEHYLAPAFRI